MKRNTFSNRTYGCLIVLFGSAAQAVAQAPGARGQELSNAASNQWWYTMIFIVAAGLGLAFYLWRKSKSRAGVSQSDPESGYITPQKNAGRISGEVDASKELEWLRRSRQPRRKRPGSSPIEDLDTRIFQEKMRKMQYEQLPINLFNDLKPARTYASLAVSDDPALLNAIDQVNEEFEEDEAVRELALRILMAFKNRNSIESLSQIALYDLSANLRSKAVAALTDFDHESVFESILLACADPTREVRAAAARGLFRLNFDRADAWKRIIETNDGFRMSHAARAAVEAGIVSKSFDRLIHEDTKVAYEAFALVSLLIHSCELDEIFDALKTHKDERVKYALLHVLKVSKAESAVERLKELSLDSSVTTDVADRIRAAISNCEAVAA